MTSFFRFFAKNHGRISLIFFIACCSIAAVIIFYQTRETEFVAMSKKFSIEKLTAYAEEHGSSAAIEFVREGAAGYEIPHRHSVAHALGEVLMKREGPVRAVAMCGSLFDYGCVHQVFGQLVAERGSDAITGIAPLCKEIESIEYGDCLHAIGHGLVDTNGYNEDAIKKSLAQCDTIQDPRGIQYLKSCYGGVFMEYMMQFLLTGPYSYVRPVDHERPYAPCDVQTTRTARRVCGFWLISWIHATYHYAFEEETFRRLGEYCRGAPSNAIRIPCEQGLGRETSVTGILDIPTVINLCRAATTNEDELVRCVKSSALTMQEENRPDDVEQACGALPSHRVSECKEYAQPMPLVE